MILDRLLDLEKTPLALRYNDREYDLEGFRRWLAELGSPQDGQLFVHVAGTKGKGSTAVLVEGLLRGLGFPTAFFSSPHLEHFGERYRYDGVPWTFEQFESALERLMENLAPEQKQILKGPHHGRTVFEFLTLLGLVEFGARPTLAAGGPRRPAPGGLLGDGPGWPTRLHQRRRSRGDGHHRSGSGPHRHTWQGDRADCRREGRHHQAGSAGHRRPPAGGVPRPRLACVGTPRRRGGVPLVCAWEHNPVLDARPLLDGQVVRLRLPDGTEEETFLPLAGSFQQHNLEAAVAAAWHVARLAGVSVSGERFLRGLGSVCWPGRLEIHLRACERTPPPGPLPETERGRKTEKSFFLPLSVSGRGPGGGVLSQPLTPAGQALVLDGAHCPLSARTAVRSLREWQDSIPLPCRPPYEVLWAMQKDKQHAAFLAGLGEGAERRLLRHPAHLPRTGSARRRRSEPRRRRSLCRLGGPAALVRGGRFDGGVGHGPQRPGGRHPLHHRHPVARCGRSRLPRMSPGSLSPGKASRQ